MRKHNKVVAAAFIISLSFATMSPTSAHAAASQTRQGDPTPSFLDRIVKQVKQILGFRTNDDTFTPPKP